jgi:hypothetical protein
MDCVALAGAIHGKGLRQDRGACALWIGTCFPLGGLNLVSLDEFVNFQVAPIPRRWRFLWCREEWRWQQSLRLAVRWQFLDFDQVGNACKSSSVRRGRQG